MEGKFDEELDRDHKCGEFEFLAGRINEQNRAPKQSWRQNRTSGKIHVNVGASENAKQSILVTS